MAIDTYALATVDELTTYFGTKSTTDRDLWETLINSTTEMIENYCNRKFISRAYTEYYNGNGSYTIKTKQYPIISMAKICVGKREALTIWNTSTYTSALVSITSIGLTLTKDGTADSTVTFASNTTISTLVGAVNALGSGWTALISSSDYNSFTSTELTLRNPSNAIDSNKVSIYMLEEPEYDYEVIDDSGIINFGHHVSKGTKNIYVSYTAGFATTPYDLKQVCIEESVRRYKRRKTIDLNAISMEDGSVNILSDNLLPHHKLVLDRYRRITLRGI